MFREIINNDMKIIAIEIVPLSESFFFRVLGSRVLFGLPISVVTNFFYFAIILM